MTTRRSCSSVKSDLENDPSVFKKSLNRPGGSKVDSNTDPSYDLMGVVDDVEDVLGITDASSSDVVDEQQVLRRALRVAAQNYDANIALLNVDSTVASGSASPVLPPVDSEDDAAQALQSKRPNFNHQFTQPSLRRGKYTPFYAFMYRAANNVTEQENVVILQPTRELEKASQLFVDEDGTQPVGYHKVYEENDMFVMLKSSQKRRLHSESNSAGFVSELRARLLALDSFIKPKSETDDPLHSSMKSNSDSPPLYTDPEMFKKALLENMENRKKLEMEHAAELSTRLSVVSSQSSQASSSGGSVSKRPRKKREQPEEQTYEVERILMKKFYRRDNVPYYLILWKNYSVDETTWQTAEDLNCPGVVETYKKRMQVIELMRKSCPKEDQVLYPYRIWEPLPLPRMQNFKRMAAWELHMNQLINKHGIAPIYIENWVDDCRPPARFEFGRTNRITDSARAHFDTTYKNFVDLKCKRADNEGCSGARCRKDRCCAVLFQQKFPYNGDKLAVDERAIHVIECSSECECSDSCPSRVVQRGRRVPVVVFRTSTRGWSVRTAAPIARNTFVMQYVGEVYATADAPNDLTYQFAMDTCGKQDTIFCIDATYYGNEARWVNHSCEPNMKTVGVLASRYDYRYQELAFFAARDIEAGEELTISYGRTDTAMSHCRCNSKICRDPRNKSSK